MADEQKPATPATPPKAAADPAKPAAATPAKSAAAGGTAAPPKPAAPAAPAKPAGPTPVEWESPMVARFKQQYGSGIEAWTYLGQNYMVVDRSLIPNLLIQMRDDEKFDYCVDVTAV